MSSPEEIRKKNQRTLILLLAAFLLPVAAAYVVYKSMDTVSKTKNYGELITPARPLDALRLQTPDNREFTIEQLKRNWHLVYLGKGTCGQACRDDLSKMHQARLAQGKAMSRVRLLYVIIDGSQIGDLEKLSDEFSHLTVVRGDEASVKTIPKLFQTRADVPVTDSRNIYIVDPLGNLMMQYRRDSRLIGIIKDLEHLLKISHVG